MIETTCTGNVVHGETVGLRPESSTTRGQWGRCDEGGQVAIAICTAGERPGCVVRALTPMCTPVATVATYYVGL